LAERRADALNRRWDGEFQRRQAAGGTGALGKVEADEHTAEAERVASALTSILIETLRSSPAADWAPLYDTNAYSEPAPVAPPPPVHEAEPQPEDFPREPLTLTTLIRPRAMHRRREAAATKFQTAHDGWSYLKRWRDQEHAKAATVYQAQLADWQAREAAFTDLQTRANARLDALIQGYCRGEPEAVVGHCDLALLALDRPDGFPCFWTTSYADGALQIDYDLPSMDAVPVVKSVKYVASRAAFDITALPEAERERLYGEAVFQTCLAVLHTLFAGDTADAIRSVTFNGWANYIDGVAVRPGRACVVSITVGKADFQALDLASLDPQACFRALNGVMSPKLAALVTRS
jgi:restriction system protein